MKNTAFLLAAALTLGSLACTNPTSGENVGQISSASTRAEIDRLKAEIRAISVANTTRTDNFDDVTAELTPLVQQLEALAPARTETETLNAVEGVWHSLWSNLDVGSPISKTDLEEVYQVVTKDGYYYNLSNARTFGFLRTVNVLRGAYVSGPDGFAIEFTKIGYRLGQLRGDLFDFAKDIESGRVRILEIPAKAPRGPIGIRGLLTTRYVDEHLRIAGGEQAPFVDEAGNVLVPGRSNLLFVLER